MNAPDLSSTGDRPMKTCYNPVKNTKKCLDPDNPATSSRNRKHFLTVKKNI